ncbi:MAG: Tad domain-containing protein [Acidobacteriota bacterium]
MNQLRCKSKRDRKGERGSILAMSALGMLSLILAVGLGVDISHFYLVKTELQNAADAAALAGATALNSSASGIIEATNRSVFAMNKYEFNQTGVTFPRTNVLFSVNLGGPYISEAEAEDQPSNIRFIKVTTPPSPVGVSFAAIVLGSSRDLTAEATAGMSIAPNLFCNWLPLSAIDYGTPMSAGNLYVIRAGPGNMVSPGDYQELSWEGKGGDDLEYSLEHGIHDCIGPGTCLPTKPGVTAGKVRQGLNTRFNGSGDADAPPDMNVKENITWAQYRTALNPATRTSSNFQAPGRAGEPYRRVVFIPIIKEEQFNNGRDEVCIDRFGVFFLQMGVSGGNGGNITAEYIGETLMVGSVGYDPDGGLGEPMVAIPVLYK